MKVEIWYKLCISVIGRRSLASSDPILPNIVDMKPTLMMTDFSSD